MVFEIMAIALGLDDPSLQLTELLGNGIQHIVSSITKKTSMGNG